MIGTPLDPIVRKVLTKKKGRKYREIEKKRGKKEKGSEEGREKRDREERKQTNRKIAKTVWK